MKRPVIFWDVDTQLDFMDAAGKLYVPGAEEIRPLLKQLTDLAHEQQFHIVASADDHVPGHKELSARPDFLETFPEHCMRGTPGAEKIAETAIFSPMIIEPEPVPHEELARKLWSHEGDVLIRKHWFDVFTNPNTLTLLEAWDPTEVVLYGVALDVCNKYAIDGLLAHGVPEIHLVLDATRAIHPDRTAALVEGWRRQDVHVVTTDDVVCGRVV